MKPLTIFSVSWTRCVHELTAKQDLREIAFYIAGHSMDNDIAKRFIMELRYQCNRLMDFPQGGAIAKDRILRSFDFRYILHKDYLIFYSIDEAQKIVSVLAIFNSKKDYLRVMRKFI